MSLFDFVQLEILQDAAKREIGQNKSGTIVIDVVSNLYMMLLFL